MTRRFSRSEFTPMEANYNGEPVTVHCMGSKWSIIVRKNRNAEMISTDDLKIVVKKRVFCHSLGDGKFEVDDKSSRGMGPAGNLQAIDFQDLEFLIPVVDRDDDNDDY